MAFRTLFLLSKPLDFVTGIHHERILPVSLNTLQDNVGARKKKIRLGRGNGSRRGGKCGRGMKGAKARSRGVPYSGYEGGQTPLHKRLPKKGFSRKSLQMPLTPLNLDKLQLWIDIGRIDPSKPIDLKVLYDSGVAQKFKHGVKLLANRADTFHTPINIEVSSASKTAIDAVEKNGGSIVCTYYDQLGLRALLKPEKFQIIPRRPKPPPKFMEHYTKFEKRGYLSPEIQSQLIPHSPPVVRPDEVQT